MSNPFVDRYVGQMEWLAANPEPPRPQMPPDVPVLMAAPPANYAAPDYMGHTSQIAGEAPKADPPTEPPDPPGPVPTPPDPPA